MNTTLDRTNAENWRGSHQLPRQFFNSLMKQSLLVCLFTLQTPDFTYAQELSIILNTNDCVNCTSALSLVPSLSNTIHVVIFCDESKRRFIPDVLSQNNIVPSSNIQIKYIKSSRIIKQSPLGSTCVFRHDGKIVFTLPLRELEEYLPSIKAFTSKYASIQRIELPNGFNLSDRTTFVANDSNILATDYIKNKTYIIHLGLNNVMQFDELTFREDLKTQAIQDLGLDMSRYNSFESSLKKERTWNPDVRSMAAYGDTMYALTTLWYPDPDPDDTSNLLLTPHPLLFSISNGKSTGVRGCQNFIPADLGDYLIMSNYGFGVQPDFICIPVFKRGIDTKPIYLLGKFIRTGATAIFHEFLDIQVPPIVEKDGPTNQYYMARIESGLYSMAIYPFFYDISTNTSFDATDLISKHSQSLFSNHTPLYWTYDARWVSENVILSLCSFEDKTWLYWFDVKHHKVIRKIEINSHDMLKETMTLNRNGSILGLSKAYSTLISIE